MSFSQPCTLLLLLALTACSGGNSPTEPGSSPLPMGIAKATALQNLALIRTLQNQKKAGTLLVGLAASCIELDGRICAESGWRYSFSDRSGPSDIRYNWTVWDTGQVQGSGPVPATGPASGLDIGAFLSTDSSQAVAIGLEERGEDYLQQFPDGFVSIFYRHFAGEVQATVRFETLSTLCRVDVVLAATSGAVIFVDDRCLTTPF